MVGKIIKKGNEMPFRRLLLVAALLFVFASGASAAVQVYLDGQPLPGDASPVVINGEVLVSLRSIADGLKAPVKWKPETQTAEFCLPDKQIIMKVDSNTAIVNGREVNVTTAPRMIEGRTFVPLAFVAQMAGLTVEWDAETPALLLYTPTAVVTGLSVEESDGRARVEILTSKPVDYKTSILTEPDRLVIDIPNARLGVEQQEHEVAAGPLTRVRLGTLDQNTVRIVLDLNRPSGYQIAPRTAGSGLNVMLNYQIGQAQIERSGDRLILKVESTGSARYDAYLLRKPDRLVMDIHEATLVGAPQITPVDDPWVKMIRTSQYSPSTVRIVLDLAFPLVPVGMSDDGNGFIGLNLYKQLALVSTSLDRGDVIVSLESLAPIEASITELISPDRLVIDLPLTVPAEGLVAGGVTGDPVKGVRVGQFAPGLTRVVVDLSRPAQYEAVYSGDRSHLDLRFKQYPLVSGTVIIDPGHGGFDPGAIGQGGTFEKDVNLDIALRLEKLLRASGATVFMTRRSDDYISLADRVAVGRRNGNAIFVSIHSNAFKSEVASGTETYYYPGRPADKHLAESIHSELVDNLGLIDRGVKTRSDLYVLRASDIPSVLVEVGFVNHPDEEKLLRDPVFRQRAAEGIYAGIEKYFSETQSGMQSAINGR